MKPVLSLVLAPGGDDAAVVRTAAGVARNGSGAWQLVLLPEELTEETRDTVRHLLGDRVRWASAPVGAPSRAALLDAARRSAEGTWVAVLGPGDEVEPGVLAAVLGYVAHRPWVDVLYTDEQWPAPGDEGIQTKPDWLPRYLEGWDYLGRLCFVHRDLVDHVGGFREGFEGAEEWDLHLRATEQTSDIEHLPVMGVTRPSPRTADPAVAEAGRRAVEDRYRRLGVGATVEVADPAGYVRVWRDVPSPPLVSLVVPTGGGRRDVRGTPTLVLETCLRSLVERTTYEPWELVLVPSEGTPQSVVDLAREIVGDRLTVAPVEGPFSFSRSVNEGVRLARGDLVVLLNDDTEVVEPRWLDRMVAVAQDPAVGVVGAKLLYEDGTIQHVGIVHDDRWYPAHVHRFAPDDASHFGQKVVDLDYVVVTGACLLTPRDLYLDLGGFTEELPLAFNDVDYCHKVRAAGRDVVCTPFATLFHYESTTRVGDVRPFELAYLDEPGTRALAERDPHVNHRAVR